MPAKRSMPAHIAPDYDQRFLLPPAVEDWVCADHPARFVREFVDALDLRELGFSIPQSGEGRPPYAPSLLLKIWLFGYMTRVRSTRRLEAACRENLGLLWLTGMIQPDHNSLWRFWRDNKKALRALFKRSVEIAARAGLVGLVLHALDGTKIQAAASGRTGWSKEQLQKLLPRWTRRSTRPKPNWALKFQPPMKATACPLKWLTGLRCAKKSGPGCSR